MQHCKQLSDGQRTRLDGGQSQLRVHVKPYHELRKTRRTFLVTCLCARKLNHSFLHELYKDKSAMHVGMKKTEETHSERHNKRHVPTAIVEFGKDVGAKPQSTSLGQNSSRQPQTAINTTSLQAR